MNAGELYDQVGEKSHRETPVMVMTEDGIIYSVKAVEYEPQSSVEGNATSTGDTLWLKVEEY